MPGATAPTTPWSPGGPPLPGEALHIETVIDPFTGQPAIGAVRHPGHPYTEALAPKAVRDEQLQALGQRYLKAVALALAGQRARQPGLAPWVHDDILDRLGLPLQSTLKGFGWLKVTWDGPVMKPRLPRDRSPLGSFWVERNEGDGALGPRSLVLLAGSVIEEHRLQLCSDAGLRIVVQVADGQARIHGHSVSGLSSDWSLRCTPTLPADAEMGDMLAALKQSIKAALGTNGPVWINSIERSRSQSPGLSVSGLALQRRQRAGAGPSRPRRSTVRDFRVEVAGSMPPRDYRVTQVTRNDFVSSDAVTWQTQRAFLSDAASQGPADRLSTRRPTRDAKRLADCLDEVLLSVDRTGTLRFVDEEPLFEARGASEGLAGEGQPRTVTVDDHKVITLGRRSGRSVPMRSDEQGSVDAYLRTAELLRRMQAYGLDPFAYFRFARLPVVSRVRPAMRWAPDGELPNAEVRPFFDDGGDADPPDQHVTLDRLQLLVMYGSANPMVREKVPLVGDTTGRKKAQYLSVASDPRWAWHEFGHVLAYASTGELELPFAHGTGDALGAIAADPLSSLATAKDPENPLRFATFPWIEVPGRSHGRSALQGYCWCGRRNTVRLNHQALLERYHHSYFGEQLMSSSLFRLYRSLGGDTRSIKADGRPGPASDRLTRLEAADYTIYLVMRALSLLGPDGVASARTADQFVGALIDADLGTGDWAVTTEWPLDSKARKLHRTGGQAHKVIRWAFERQGLYACDSPTAVAEGPGLPPAVDVFIADRRPATGPDAEPGGYAPVALRQSNSEPWHADPAALSRQGGTVSVRLENRGPRPADDVSLRLWWAPPPKVGGSLRWKRAIVTAAARQFPPGSRITCKLPLTDMPAGPLWVLVSADAPADPSNLRDGLPPEDPKALCDLVALDNNLALALL